VVALGIRDWQNGGSTMVISRLANEWLAANKLELDQWVAKASAAH
jgi:glycine betaine/proline transport system substrate-binding protein